VSIEPPFLDPGPISDPGPADDDLVEQNGTQHPSLPPPVSSGPCADCTRYAQVGYVIGAVVGITAGATVAYFILRDRLAPS
jgi:hypothetical protein